MGGAVEAAAAPRGMRAEFLDPAREAFTQGLQVAATVSAAIILVAAILVATVLRRAETQSDERAAAPAGSRSSRACERR